MIKPLRGYVLIEPDKAEDTTASGFVLPDNAQEKPQKGTVVAVGDKLDKGGGWVESAPAEINSRVYCKRWGGDDITYEGKELKLVKFDDLLAVIE